MSIAARRWRLAGLIVLAVVCATGCNIPQLLYFLYPGPDIKEAPELAKLVPPEKKKEVKVVILTYAGVETRPEFITADRDLSGRLAQYLQKGFKENKENVAIVPASKVQDFKNKHSNWQQTMDLKEVGKHFDADYLIYLEIDSLTLYEKGSQNTLYRGNAAISVSLVDLNNPDADPLQKNFQSIYPNSRPIAVEESTLPRGFYFAFLDYMAKRLSWYFLPHDISQDITCE